MNKRFIGVIFSLFAAAMLVGCAGLKPSEPLTFTPQKFDAGKYSPKVENFQIIIDASESMDTNMHGEKKYLTAKNFVSALNQSIPAHWPTMPAWSLRHHPKQSEDTTEIFLRDDPLHPERFFRWLGQHQVSRRRQPPRDALGCRRQ